MSDEEYIKRLEKRLRIREWQLQQAVHFLTLRIAITNRGKVIALDDDELSEFLEILSPNPEIHLH